MDKIKVKTHCQYCQEALTGRSDKKFCNAYCKSAYQYEQRKAKESLFFKIDRQLKKNRSLLKYFNQAGKSVIRKEDLLERGFDPMYFTHYWKNPQAKVYLFCYEYGFMEIQEHQRFKYLLVQWQTYMNKKK